MNVAETATFSANIDANGDLDVDGHTYLDNVNVSGIVTSNAGFAGTVLSQDGTGYVLIPGASQNDTSQLYNTNLYDSLGRVVTNMVAGSDSLGLVLLMDLLNTTYSCWCCNCSWSGRINCWFCWYCTISRWHWLRSYSWC